MRTSVPISASAILIFLLLGSAFAATIDETCAQVGAISGCSGCEQGTNGLCRYVAQKLVIFGSTYSSYNCYSAQKASQLVLSGSSFSYAASVCSSPSTESTFRTTVQTGSNAKKRGVQSSVGPKKAGTVFSKGVKSGNVQFADGEQDIDRTASTQPLGGLNGASEKRFIITGNYAPLTCENFNSPRLHTVVDEFDGCSGFGTAGVSISPAQRACIITVRNIWGVILCPPYGHALSGYAETLVDQVSQTCIDAGCQSVWPWDYFSNVLLNSLVVDDDTPYAVTSIGDFDIGGVTGSFEKANNLVQAATVPSAIPGLEMSLGQTFAWPGGSMSFNDAVNLLTDPNYLTPKNVRTNVVPYALFDRYGCSDCQTAPGAILMPQDPRANGSVMQLSGFINVPYTGNYTMSTYGDAFTYVVVGNASFFGSFSNQWNVTLTAGRNSILGLYWNCNGPWLLPIYLKINGFFVGDWVNGYTVSTYSQADLVSTPDPTPF